MAQYTGKVSKIFPARFGGSFGLDGQYNLYFNTKQALPAFVVPGASVSFEAEMGRNGKSVYVSDATLKSVAPPAPATPAGNTGGGGSFADRDNSIKYQSSRKDALAMVGLLVSTGALFDPSKPPARTKLAGIIEDAVDRFTALYFDDIEELGALNRVPVPEAPEKAPADQLPE